jgi:hypothetical protein
MNEEQNIVGQDQINKKRNKQYGLEVGSIHTFPEKRVKNYRLISSR